MKYVKFTDKDPRRGQTVHMDDGTAQRLIDSGNAEEVSEEEAKRLGVDQPTVSGASRNPSGTADSGAPQDDPDKARRLGEASSTTRTTEGTGTTRTAAGTSGEGAASSSSAAPAPSPSPSPSPAPSTKR